MNMTNTTVSLEDLLRDKVTKLNELKLATVLLGHRGALREQLSEAKLEMHSIKKGIDAMRHDLEIMKAQNTHCCNLALSLSQLDAKIVRMEENLPVEFIQEFNRLNEASPCVKVTSGSSIPANQERTVNGQLGGLVADIGVDTPEHRIGDCKKILFKRAEDSYSMDPLNEEEFSKIPKYMIGRQSLVSLNDLVTSINAILDAKYGLLALGKNGARKKGKLDLYLSLKRDEIVVAPGEEPVYFFTAEDYHRHTQTKLDKTKLNLLTVLRHCKRLRESRRGKSLQYVVVSNSDRCKSGMNG